MQLLQLREGIALDVTQLLVTNLIIRKWWIIKRRMSISYLKTIIDKSLVDQPTNPKGRATQVWKRTINRWFNKNKGHRSRSLTTTALLVESMTIQIPKRKFSNLWTYNQIRMMLMNPKYNQTLLPAVVALIVVPRPASLVPPQQKSKSQ